MANTITITVIIFLARVAGHLPAEWGGIGIMNIMLGFGYGAPRNWSAQSAGAKKSDIMIQFLIESGLLSLLGGILAFCWARCCPSRSARSPTRLARR
jgi:hypothetical protein